ncbi:ferritin-like domain-containing protein [uncultured Polaribacter sp.]|uniref:ferritin-like domain-containing protein n=1 Tax=uncultured Polaribacter sp. TaxID=174711 RepID=UPI00344E0C75
MIAEIQDLLNDQIKYEANASMQYMSMASWAENTGFSGVANFFLRTVRRRESTHDQIG